MQAILKALGLTIWGAIGILLSVIFVVVAFEVVTKYRASGAFDLENESNGQPSPSRTVDSAASVALSDRAPDLRVHEVVPGAAVETHCANTGATPRVALDATQRARLAHLLNSSEAAKAESGDAFVRLGKQYYGFGAYQLAIASLERGLEKGHVMLLEDAYVYLGRSEVAVGDLDAARDAFAMLQDVPNISSNVLRLWTLYAEMLPESSKSATVNAAECLRSGQP